MWRDDAYLLDILLAARRILDFTAPATEASFRTNELLQSAVIRQFEIIGEAARRVSSDTMDAHPEVPWQALIGMRNRLIHEYNRVRLDTVWETIVHDVPELVRLIEPLVPSTDD